MPKQNTQIGSSLFSIRLKNILSERNKTQQELANILGVQRQTVSLYVNGQIRPDIDTLSVIARTFNISSDWLLGLTDDHRIHPIATDELGLSAGAVKKLKSYADKRWYGNTKTFSSVDMIISHDIFEEMVQSFDRAISMCSESLMASSCGETESSGEKKAHEAHDLLEGTRWTPITSAKYAEYLVYSTQQLFARITNDITNVHEVHEIMEY